MSKQQIEECVRSSLEGYLRDLHGEEPANLHALMMGMVEKPLLEVVMAHARNNQSRAAQWLGLNRNTLRKKLADHRVGEAAPGEARPGEAPSATHQAAG